ncbi:EAL domain-containing protein [Echinimonas agarilytica]|uniref:EAL domain-containing protein n=1 Tax=Echinimonas agarilytica TaxID=1215918 RepID=A0AA41W5V3_9GAMM|nr:EAL domain-containing protein [Echinimonas agarilytica]MCM2679250.1 EAL domain-containing protein [Echinimonas agarilytica]
MGAKTIRSVAVYTPMAHGFYYGQLCQHLNHLAFELNLEIHMICTGNLGRYDSELSLNNVDAVISIKNAIGKSLINTIVNKQIPLISIGHQYSEHQIDCVISDNRDGLAQIFAYLFERGYQQITFAGDLDCQEINERYHAFMECQQAYQIVPLANDLINLKGQSYSAGNQAADHLVNFEDAPQAVICGNDLIASGLIDRLAHHSWRVPEDVCVVSFEAQQSDHSNRVSVSHDPFLLAEFAIEQLMRRAEHPEQGQQTILVENKLLNSAANDDPAFTSKGTKALNLLELSNAFVSSDENLHSGLEELLSLKKQIGHFTEWACLANWQRNNNQRPYIKIIEMHGDGSKLDTEVLGAKAFCRAEDFPLNHWLDKYVVNTAQILSFPIIVNNEAWGFICVAGSLHSPEQLALYQQFVGLVSQLAQRHERDVLETLAIQQGKQSDRLQRRLQAAAQKSTGGLWEWDLATDQTTWNDRALEMLGFTSPESQSSVRNMGLFDRMNTLDRAVVQKRIASHIKHGMPLSVNFRMLCNDKTTRWFAATGEVISGFDGRPKRVIGSIQDVTEKRRSDQRFKMMASYDALTGLPNRSMVSDQLAQQIRRSPQQPLAVIQIGLDRFKHLNNQHGHEAGDKLLRHVTTILKNSLRDHDFYARFSGDEFVCLCPVDNQRQAIVTANRLLNKIEQPLHDALDIDFFVTASIGIALYPDHADTPADLLRRADMAMHQSKANGKNQTSLYKASIQADRNTRARIDNELRKAIISNELSLVYQPQICPVTNKLTGVEALIRWHSKELGEISPAEFIPLAEENGQIVELGYWVLKEACSTLKKWQKTFSTHINMSVNVSAAQLANPMFLKTVHQILQVSAINPKYITMEITESTAIADMDNVRSILEQLSQHGIQISLDDFGTGFSSISLLRQLPLTSLKIDRSFFNELKRDSQDWLIIKAIQELGSAMGHKVVAEGVETLAQLDLVRELECDVVQGYVYSQPLAQTALEASYFLPQDSKIRSFG